MTREEIYKAIEAEREEQDREYGGTEHDDSHNSHNWIAFIVKHLGRAVTGGPDQFQKQMIRVAALAVAAHEWCDRNKWSW